MSRLTRGTVSLRSGGVSQSWDVKAPGVLHVEQLAAQRRQRLLAAAGLLLVVGELVLEELDDVAGLRDGSVLGDDLSEAAEARGGGLARQSDDGGGV